MPIYNLLMKIRRQLRVPMPITVKVKRGDDRGFEDAQIGDISWGGVLLFTDSQPDMGSRLLIEFDIPDQPVMLEVWGTVVRPHNENGSHGVGVEFDELDSESRSQIQVLVNHFVRAQFSK